MTIIVAIVGLGVLILVHELGHFLVSLGLGMRPRRFYIGFPPAIWKRTHNGIEYGVGAIPLGGFVKIPGMHRPYPGDVDMGLGRVLGDVPSLQGAAGRLRGALAADDHDAARDSLRVLRELVAERDLPPQAAASVLKGARRPRRRARPERLLARGDVEAGRGDRGRACRQHPARARPLHRALHDVGREGDDDGRGGHGRLAGRQRRACSQGIGSSRSTALSSSRATSHPVISGSDGRKLTVVVVRDGARVTLPPTSAELRDGAYRLGFMLAGEGLPPLAGGGRVVHPHRRR